MYMYIYLRLLEDSIYPQHMIQYFIKQYQRNIQFLLVEHLQPGLHIITKLFLVHWKVILSQPVTVEDRPGQGSLGESGEGEGEGGGGGGGRGREEGGSG